MDAYKIIAKFFFSLSAFFLMNAASAEWVSIDCPKSKELYIPEAINLIVSGHKSNQDSVCLNQTAFKYFDLSINDTPDVPVKVIIINDDFKFFIIDKKIEDSGNLSVTYKIVSGLNVETDQFTLYFNTNIPGVKIAGCAGFFNLPNKHFLKKSCQAEKNEEAKSIISE